MEEGNETTWNYKYKTWLSVFSIVLLLYINKDLRGHLAVKTSFKKGTEYSFWTLKTEPGTSHILEKHFTPEL